MLTAVHVETDEEKGLVVHLVYDDGSDYRTFWVRNVSLLEQVARIALEWRVDEEQMNAA